jgi:hypothetical protein
MGKSTKFSGQPVERCRHETPQYYGFDNNNVIQKHFTGDNENAIEIQIWTAMLANLLITLVKSRVKRSWAFSNHVSIIRQQLMNYINIYGFLEDPEGSWREIIKENKMKYQNSLFPEMEEASF